MNGIPASILYPCALGWEAVGDPLRRAWAHARRAATLGEAVDPSVVILGPAEIHGAARIELGRNLYLYRDLYLETQEEGVIDIADDVVLSRGVHIVAYAAISIGAGSMIGEYTSIRDANHRFRTSEAIRASGHDAQPIRIGRHVLIRRGVTVLGGVTIGDDAVVGANAVVTRDVPAATVVAGVPARTIDTRVIETRTIQGAPTE